MKMKQTIVLKILLGVAGLLITLPGLMALFNPGGFTARNGADIAGVVSLLNDYRGMGGMMLGTGLITFLGIFHSRMTFTSTVVAMVMYLLIALGRAFSIGVDGIPAKGLVAATIVEAVIGVLLVIALMKYRDRSAG